MNIDDVFEKAKEAVNIAAKKTEEVVNISKLKLEASKVEGEIKSAYEKLGNSVYQMKQDGYQNDDLVSSLCEEVDDLRAKLDGINSEIAALQNVIVCPVCSYKNIKDSFYCAKCGAKLRDDDYKPAEETVYAEAEEVSDQESTDEESPEA